MLHFPFFRPMLCLAPDAGGASGEAAVDNPEQQTGQAEAAQDAQKTETQADAQAAPATEGLYPAAASGGSRREERRESQGAKGDHASSPEQPAEENQTESDTERAQEDEPEKEQTAPLKERLANMQAKLGEYQLRTAAALSGVPKERIPYVMRMADVTGLDPCAADAAEHYQKAVDKVLYDVPELRGGAGTGSTGNFARKPVEPVDPDIAKITRNILG